MAIWQDFVDDHGFPVGDAGVRRFVSALPEQPPVETRAVITTAPGKNHKSTGVTGQWSVIPPPASTGGRGSSS